MKETTLVLHREGDRSAPVVLCSFLGEVQVSLLIPLPSRAIESFVPPHLTSSVCNNAVDDLDESLPSSTFGTLSDWCPSPLLDVWHMDLGDRLIMRPASAQDIDLLSDLIRRCSARTRYYRFQGAVEELPVPMHGGKEGVDLGKCHALVIAFAGAGGESIVADARFLVDKSGRHAEFAVLVEDRMQRHGIGESAVRSLVRHARGAGLASLYATILRPDAVMRSVLRRCGFVRIAGSEDARTVVLERRLGAEHDCHLRNRLRAGRYTQTISERVRHRAGPCGRC